MTITCAEVRELAAAFVLGALDPAEDAAIREHLATCPDAHEEIAGLGGVVPYLAGSLEPVEPPPALRGRILAAAAASAASASASRGPVEAAGPTPGSPGASVVDEPTSPIPFPGPGSARHDGISSIPRPGAARTPAMPWVLRIAAVLAVVLLAGWNLQLQGRLSSVEDDLAAARSYSAGVAAILDVAAETGSTTAILVGPTGTRATGVAAASVDGRLLMALHDLAPTAGTSVYEAWAIVGGTSPVPLGGFTVGSNGTAVFEVTTAAAAPGAVLALTLEPAAGATTPTLPILTSGSLLAASS
jgi:anti-sigma-K factor RskA